YNGSNYITYTWSLFFLTLVLGLVAGDRHARDPRFAGVPPGEFPVVAHTGTGHDVHPGAEHRTGDSGRSALGAGDRLRDPDSHHPGGLWVIGLAGGVVECVPGREAGRGGVPGLPGSSGPARLRGSGDARGGRVESLEDLPPRDLDQCVESQGRGLLPGVPP